MSISLYDELILKSSYSLSVEDENVLTLLYLPIMGIDSYSLYKLMTSLTSNKENRTTTITHSILCDMLVLSPNNFEKARIKLESLGLVQTFKKENSYRCIINNPQSPKCFLNDSILGNVLKEKVGENIFNNIITIFKKEEFVLDEYKEITKTFDDSFEVKKKSLDIKSVIEKRQQKVKKEFKFNYDVFKTKIKNYLDQVDDTISLKNKVLMLAETYDLNEDDMNKIYKSCFINKKFNILMMNDEATKYLKRKNNISIDIESKDLVKVEIDDSSKFKLKELIIKYFKVSNPSNIKIMAEVMEKTGFKLDVIDDMLKTISENTNGVFPNEKYIEKVTTTYIQQGIRKKKDIKKTDIDKKLIEEFYANMED